MTALYFALLSLLCAAFNDVVFKLYASGRRPVGYYLAVIGAVWFSFFIILYGLWSVHGIDGTSLFWGTVSGLFSASANILLIEAMARHEVGICATIYRLNLAPAAILAFIFLGENISFWKIMGIAAAIGAVILFSQPSKTSISKESTAALWMLAAASLFRACMGITYKCGLEYGADMYLILALNGFIWILSGISYHFIAERKKALFSFNTCAFGLFSGVLVCGIVIFMMLALKRGEASMVLPVSQLSFFVSALIGVFFLKERLNRRKSLGLFLAFLCVFFMAMVRG